MHLLQKNVEEEKKMIDSHVYPADWGVMPYIKIGFFSVPSYETFVLFALAVGIFVYYLEARKKRSVNEKTFLIAFGAIVGGTLGAKLPIWIMNYKYILANVLTNPMVIFPGRTITGGLVGGFIGVLLTKRLIGVKEKRGNMFAPAIAIGVAIGRLGCFFRGCCYGKETGLPWGVDFGDGLMRHPTQIYEAIFMMIMFFIILKKKKNAKPGELFRLLMISYFSFRFVIEFIRVEPVIFLGLTFFQWVSIIVVIYFNRENILKLYKKIS